MLREMVIDFVLFSFVEGLLYAMFFNRVCKCKKFNVFEIIVMSIGNCVVSDIYDGLDGILFTSKEWNRPYNISIY